MKVMFVSCAIIFGFSVRASDRGFDENNVAEYAHAIHTIAGKEHLLNMMEAKSDYSLPKDISAQLTEETRQWRAFCDIRMVYTQLAFDGDYDNSYLLGPDRLLETLRLCCDPIQKTVGSSLLNSCFGKRNKFEQFAHQVKEGIRGMR
jgi:hypothetical protein